MQMLVILPVVAYIGLSLLMGNWRPEWEWRRCVLRAAVLWGAYLVLVTEGLSLLRGVTPTNLALAWGLAILAVAAGLALHQRGGRAVRWPKIALPNSTIERLALLGLLIILSLTALVAWLTPPQTWDSLNYHMTRVAHWAQERSVGPFATGIETQNSMPAAAEFAVLHSYVLSRGDRLANFVAWFAMLGSVAGVSYVAKQLGTATRGQWIAALFAASIPMGIVQASSTMTDYIVAFWMICVASESVALVKREGEKDVVFYLSLGSGLALLTKPTAAAYLLPFAVLVGVTLIRRVPLGRVSWMAVVAVALVAVINGGHWVRTTSLYGSPIPPARIQLHANKARNLRGLVSNAIRNAGLHLGTPSPHLNKGILLSILAVHDWLEIDVNDPRTTRHSEFRIRQTNTSELTTGNPVHLLIILIAAGIVAVRGKAWSPALLIYGLTVASTVLVFSFIFKWQPFGSRYHLPFFILSAPLIGYVVERVFSGTVVSLLGLLLVLSSYPWLTGIRSRPLIPIPDRPYISSVIVEPREKMYFGNARELEPPYQTMTNLIRSAECSEVGIFLSGNGIEYPIWALLGAPRDSLQIEWIVAGTPSERYAKPDFHPCAAICQSCPSDWTTVRGLPQTYEYGKYRLFLAEEPAAGPGASDPP